MRSALILIALVVACKDRSGPSSSSPPPADPVTTAPPVPPPPPPALPIAPVKAIELTTYCGGTPCPCKTGTTEKATTSAQTCELEAPLGVQNVACAPGRLEFYGDGSLKRCEQAKSPYEAEGGIVCEGGWAITFHPNHRLARCAGIHPISLGGFELAGPNLALFDDGTVAAGEIAKDIELDGITCRRTIQLYKGNHLQSCQVAAPVSRAGVALQPGDIVTLRKDGTLKRVQLDKDTTLDGRPLNAGIVCFDDKQVVAATPTNECSAIASETDP